MTSVAIFHNSITPYICIPKCNSSSKTVLQSG